MLHFNESLLKWLAMFLLFLSCCWN